jgi:cysteine desulfurase
MPIDVNDLGIDLMSFSAHKIYGPKGSGALYHRMSDRKTELHPLQFGGGQEGGIRSGTLNVPGIVGLAAAGSIALSDLDTESVRICDLRDRFEAAMQEIGARVNGTGADRCYNISNVTFPDVSGHHLQLEMEQVACSQGSACSSAKTTPSHVLTAMGRTVHETECSLRFSFGRYSTDVEVDELISTVRSAVNAVQRNTAAHHTP